jgi:hypothetical protein
VIDSRHELVKVQPDSYTRKDSEMETHTVAVEKVPGTNVLLVKENPGNPARKRADCHLFRNGYWEVHIISTGEHPDFRKGQWKILLVSLTQQEIECEIEDGLGLCFIPILPMTRPEHIKIDIERFEDKGTVWQFPRFTITLDNQSVCEIPCDTPKPISLSVN